MIVTMVISKLHYTTGAGSKDHSLIQAESKRSPKGKNAFWAESFKMVRWSQEEDVTDTADQQCKDKELCTLGMGKKMQIFQNSSSIDLKGF